MDDIWTIRQIEFEKRRQINLATAVGIQNRVLLQWQATVVSANNSGWQCKLFHYFDISINLFHPSEIAVCRLTTGQLWLWRAAIHAYSNGCLLYSSNRAEIPDLNQNRTADHLRLRQYIFLKMLAKGSWGQAQNYLATRQWQFDSVTTYLYLVQTRTQIYDTKKTTNQQ